MNLEDLKKHISTVVAHPQATTVDSVREYASLPFYVDSYRRYSNDAYRLVNNFTGLAAEATGNSYRVVRDIRDYLNGLNLYIILPKEVDENTIEVYMTKSAFAKKIPSTMKIGKFYKKIAPFASDSLIESHVNKWKDYFRKVEYVFHESEPGDEEAFTKVYNMRVSERRGEISDYSSYRKSLTDSCMQRKFANLEPENCPLKAYNSGDWKILWATEEEKGGEEPRLAARTIVSTKINKHSAVYGVNNGALNFLHKKLEELGYKNGSEHLEDIDFSGHRLLAIAYSNTDNFHGPYLDTYPKSARLSSNEKYFYLDEDGEYNFSDTSGDVLCAGRCDRCGDVEYIAARYPHQGNGYCNCCDEDYYDDED